MPKYPIEPTYLNGSKSKWKEYVFSLNVLWEFIKGFKTFRSLGKCATVYGSARFPNHSNYYKMALEIGKILAELDFTVMTGGGPGAMEAANKGAKQAGGKSVGCNIQLPEEQLPNLYLDKWITIKYFFVRKVLLMKYSCLFVVLPGGYGTLDEFSESLMLIQTKKRKAIPIILVGKKFHEHLIKHFDKLVQEGMISHEEMDLFFVTDDLQEFKEYVIQKCTN